MRHWRLEDWQVVRALFVGFLLIGLAACNGTGTKISAATLYKARATYDAVVLAPAARYAQQCREAPTVQCKSVVVKLQKADSVASSTLATATTFIRLHPTLDASSYIDAAQSAIAIAMQVAVTYGVK